MCEPTTIITAVAAVAGAVQQDRNASKQRKAYRKAQAEEEKQINRKNSIEANQRLQQAKAARAKIKARAAGAGISGLTLDTLQNNVDYQAGTDLAVLEGNNEYAVDSSRSQLQSRLNATPGANWLNTGLQIAGAVTNDSKFGGGT